MQLSKVLSNGRAIKPVWVASLLASIVLLLLPSILVWTGFVILVQTIDKFATAFKQAVSPVAFADPFRKVN